VSPKFTEEFTKWDGSPGPRPAHPSALVSCGTQEPDQGGRRGRGPSPHAELCGSFQGHHISATRGIAPFRSRLRYALERLQIYVVEASGISKTRTRRRRWVTSTRERMKVTRTPILRRSSITCRPWKPARRDGHPRWFVLACFINLRCWTTPDAQCEVPSAQPYSPTWNRPARVFSNPSRVVQRASRVRPRQNAHTCDDNNEVNLKARASARANHFP